MTNLSHPVPPPESRGLPYGTSDVRFTESSVLQPLFPGRVGSVGSLRVLSEVQCVVPRPTRSDPSLGRMASVTVGRGTGLGRRVGVEERERQTPLPHRASPCVPPRLPRRPREHRSHRESPGPEPPRVVDPHFERQPSPTTPALLVAEVPTVETDVVQLDVPYPTDSWEWV